MKRINRMKKKAEILLAAVLALGVLGGCGSSSGENSGQEQEGKLYPLSRTFLILYSREYVFVFAVSYNPF